MFLTPFKAQSAPRARWTLLAPLRYELRAFGTRTEIEVPAGYTTDLASVPRPLWPIFPRDGGYREAAVLHDFIYTDATSKYTRAEADYIFRLAMADLGISIFGRWPMWLAVRLFGRGNWK